MTAVTWDDEAKCELNCSALYLAKRGGGALGERFISNVEAAIASARSSPRLYRKFHGDARKVRIDRFPYHVVYWHDEESDSIHVVAIAHASRNPSYWRDRLPG
jgi:plasmid stabilization system protein ParE